MPFPVYRDDRLPTLPTLPSTTTTNPLSTSASSPAPYRPTRSSPLSSSPIRLSSASPPLSPRDPNIRRDTIQSSPTIPRRQPAAAALLSSKFASRPARPNPVTAAKREVAQESRRKLFLKNVRQRAEDQRWERRGGEQEWLKLEWWSLHRDLHQAANADVNGVIFDSDIEDAARLREEVMRGASRSRTLGMIPEASASQEQGLDGDVDAMLVDMFEQEQQAELDAAVAEAMAMAGSGQQQSLGGDGSRPRSPQWDDDEDYDALFMDYLAQEEEQQQEGPVHSQDVGDYGDMDLS